MITYHLGDATQPDLAGEVTIAHVLSDVPSGVYDAGFAAALAVRHPSAQARFKAWARGEPDAGTARAFLLGNVQWVGVGHDVGRTHRFSARWVANMVAQHGLGRHNHPLDLDALDVCLHQLADHTRGPIAMPRIGCGLAGGTWDEVEPIISGALKAHDVHVYDLARPVGVDAQSSDGPNPNSSSMRAINSSPDDKI